MEFRLVASLAEPDSSDSRELLLGFVEPSVDLLREVIAHDGAERGVIDHAAEEVLIGVEAIDDETFEDLVERELEVLR
jgi:hypothetical protein